MGLHGDKEEHAMMKWFKGKIHPSDAVDFQTKNCLWEVKSCNLFNEYRDGKGIQSNHFGRFQIKTHNHKKLLELCIEEQRIAKYVFVLKIGKRLVFKVLPWNYVNKFIKDKYYFYVRVKDVFK